MKGNTNAGELQGLPWKGRTYVREEELYHRSEFTMGEMTRDHKRPLHCTGVSFQGQLFSLVLIIAEKENKVSKSDISEMKSFRRPITP